MVVLFLLAFSLSIDALGAGITYGLRRISFSSVACLLLFLMTMGMMFCFLGIGRWIVHLFPHAPMEKIGAFFLLCFGCYLILSACRKPKQNHTISNCFKEPTDCDRNHSKTLEPKEALLLGLVLSTDSFGIGMSIAASGLSHVLLPVLAAFFQTAFLVIGAKLGKTLFSHTVPRENCYSFVSGLLFTGIALLRFF